MKIAVLISGDYRLFEECFPTYRHLLVGTDVYFSTWSSTEIVHPADRSIYVKKEINKEIIQYFFNDLTLINTSIETYNSNLWNKLKYNSTMVYRWNKGLELIKNSGITYDYIAILRPDVFLDSGAKINWNNIKDNELHEAWYSREGRLTDLFLIGKADIIFSSIPKVHEWISSGIRDWHTMFYEYVSRKHIDIKRLNFVDCLIGRPGKLPLTSYQNAFINFEYWRNSTIQTQVFKYGSKSTRGLWTDKLYNNIFFKDNPLAVIFDLDGVIVDTGKLHYRALKESVEKLTGVNIDYRENISAQSMLSTKEKVAIIKDYYSFDSNTVNKILEEKDIIFNQAVDEITVSDNILSLLHYIKSKNIKLAIASNSRHINIDRILTVLGIKDLFDAVVSAEDVENRKPSPDILFKVYEQLNLSKEESIRTLFIEDTDEGAEAGYKSPSTTIKINSIDELTVDFISKWIK